MCKCLPNAIRVVLILMLLSMGAMCALWFPVAVDYVGGFYESAGDFEYVKGWLYVICAIVSLPLFAVFIIAFSFPPAIENDSVFTKKTARNIKCISNIIFADCIVFAATVIWIIWMGERILSPVLAFVDVIGIMVAFMLYVLSGYISRAAVLKEEADHTL